MRVLFNILLRVVHFIYSAIIFLRPFWKTSRSVQPQPLSTPRRRIPQHLSVLFAVASNVEPEAAQDCMVESVVNIVKWCRIVGVRKLTVYDEHGFLLQCAPRIRELLSEYSAEQESSDSDIDYPLTPPPSDYSESRPISPERAHETIVPATTIHIASNRVGKQLKPVRQRHPSQKQATDPERSHPLTLCLVSHKSAKPAIAAAARHLARTRRWQTNKTEKRSPFTLTVDELNKLLEDEAGLSAPDFMIIHPISFSRATEPPELHGFPPWHIRLTEIYQNRIFEHAPLLSNTHSPFPLDEMGFSRALDEYASAEMRFGK